MRAAESRTEIEDHRFMARALELAGHGYYSARPNPRVGCVVTKDGAIVGEGFHYKAGEPHAEINALRDTRGSARGGTVYVTLEPCCHHGRTPPCTTALLAAGVQRVVYAVDDPDPRVAGGGAGQLRANGIDVTADVMSKQAVVLNRGFFCRMRRGVPFVTIKLGMTFDAKIALASGASRWITGPAARADVQRLRAASGAILTGVGTVVADDPALTLRDDRFDTAGRQPLRVVLDSRLRCLPSSKLFKAPGETLVFAREIDDQKARALRAAGATVEKIQHGESGLDINSVLKRLADYEVNELLVEAGPTVAAALIREGMFNQIIVYVAPKIFGDGGLGGFKLPSPIDVDDALELQFCEVRQIDSDLRITLAPRE